LAKHANFKTGKRDGEAVAIGLDVVLFLMTSIEGGAWYLIIVGAGLIARADLNNLNAR
jgi:hypothetical protein